MSDFLRRLAERQLAAVPAVAPRALSRFAPAPSIGPDTQIVPTPQSPVSDDERVATTQRVVRVDTERLIESVVTSPEGGVRRADVHVTPHQHLPPTPSPLSAVATDRRADGLSAADDQSAVSHVTSTPALLVPSPAWAVDRPGTETLRKKTAAEHPRRDPSSTPQPTPSVPALLVPRSPLVTSVVPPPMHPMEPHPVASAEPPSVKVTIGRIEVRAVTPPPRRTRASVDRQEALSLEDYLDRRRGGRR